jgi:hypothetical protein
VRALAFVLTLAPITAAAQPVTEGDDDARDAARRALEASLEDRRITHAFTFEAGHDTVVLFADAFGGERPEPCPDAPTPAFEVDCEEPPQPSPPSAGLARVIDGRVEMIVAPRPFVRFDWELEDTNGDGDNELTVLVEFHEMYSERDVDHEHWVVGPVGGKLAMRARIPLAGGHGSRCGAHGYWALGRPEAAQAEGRSVLRVRYARAAATANCQDLGSPEGPLCDCEETSMVVDLRFRADGTLAGLPPWHSQQGPFARYRIRSNDGE